MAVDYDVVVIGGGSGGLVVASAAAQSKAKVALVEKHRLGGDCLWFGCVPSKSLLHAARAAHTVKYAQKFGIYTHPPDIHFAEANQHVRRAIANIEPHDSPERFRGLGVDVIFGSGHFRDRNTFVVDSRELKARNFVVSTGSRPAIPPIQGLQEAGFLTNEQVFSLETRPNSLAVIGAGPIGCELGQAFHRLGAQVTIFSSREQILPKEDPKAAAVVEQQLLSEGIRIVKHARVERVELADGKKRLIAGGEAIEVDEILLSTGRTPNVEELNLEAAGIEYSDRGIAVNQKLQTTNRKIYACGDVIGGYQFTHVAGHEAAIVFLNALFLPVFKADYSVMPWATFTEPELARVGLTEAQARQRFGDDIVVIEQEFADVDRAQAEAAIAGHAKFVLDPKGQILGAHIVGPSAGELLHEVVIAMKNKQPITALAGYTHIYPTLSEVNSKAALQFRKQSFAKNQFLQSFLVKFFNFRRAIA